MVFKGSNLFMGYIGDSRAIMGSKDNNDSMVAIQLTVDLKPDLPSKSLLVIRSFGDLNLEKSKKKKVICGFTDFSVWSLWFILEYVVQFYSQIICDMSFILGLNLEITIHC